MPIPTTSVTVTGKFQSTLSICGTYPIEENGVLREFFMGFTKYEANEEDAELADFV
jgi:hypothetical protein